MSIHFILRIIRKEIVEKCITLLLNAHNLAKYSSVIIEKFSATKMSIYSKLAVFETRLNSIFANIKKNTHMWKQVRFIYFMFADNLLIDTDVNLFKYFQKSDQFKLVID